MKAPARTIDICDDFGIFRVSNPIVATNEKKLKSRASYSRSPVFEDP